MDELGTLVGLAYALLTLTYECGVLVQTLPVPRRNPNVINGRYEDFMASSFWHISSLGAEASTPMVDRRAT